MADPQHHFADIVIERGAQGGPHLTIDGVRLHAFTQGIKVSTPTRLDPPTVTVTFLAARVEMRDNDLPPKEVAWGVMVRACATCGMPAAVGYENVRGQWFCWPCADGESPEGEAAVARSVADADASGQPADGG